MQGPGALMAVGEGMRAHDDRAPFGPGQEAGHHGRSQGRLDLPGGRQGREGLEIEAWRGLEALFRLGGRQRVPEGQIEVHRARQRALGALPAIDQQLPPVAEEVESGPGHRGLGGPDGESAEEPLLGDGLAGVAFAKFRGAVGGQHEQRGRRQTRLHHGREVVGARGA